MKDSLKKLLGMGLAMVALAGSMPAFGAEHLSYGIEYAYGTWASRSQVTTTATLLFPGAELTELQDITFYAYQEPTSANAGWGQSYFTHAYPAEGDLQFLVTTVQRYDGGYIKGTVIKLTQGVDGVYGQQLETPWYQTGASNLTTWDAVKIDADGTVVPNDPRTGTEPSRYKFTFLHTFAPVPTTAKLVFANAPGEPTLTVNDLRNFQFSGWMQGDSIGSKFTRAKARNVFKTEEDGVVTKILMEFQILDGTNPVYLKCVAVELTNGEGGVYARATKAAYVSGTNPVGFRFLNDDGTLTADATEKTVAAALGAKEYGIAGLTAREVVRTHYGYGYLHGTFQSPTRVPQSRALVFPGATLADLKGATFFSYVAANSKESMDTTGMGQSYFVHAYPDSEDPEFLVAAIQRYDGGHIKATVVKFTEDIPGVYAQELCTPYYTTTDRGMTSTHDFVNVSGTGAITYNCTGGNAKHTYQYKFLNTLAFVPVDAPALLFANGEGEPTLTLDGLRDCKFTGFVAGGFVSAKFASGFGENLHYEKDADGKLTKIRIEMQMMDDKYLKCVVIELTNGEGGVWGQAVRCCHVEPNYNPYIGFKLLNDDGTLRENVTSRAAPVASFDGTGGYGVAGLVATLTNTKSLALDRSMTWSELAGSARPVKDTELVIDLDVTADATLTFDVPIEANTLVVRSEQGCSVAFAAEGVHVPEIALWDTRETTGDITFSGFTPVTDAKTDNILPNAASTLFFNGPTNGKLPFNETAVKVPCKAVALGNGAALDAFAFGKVTTFAVTDKVTLNGKVTGKGVIALTADGSIDIAPNVTLANTVTLSVPTGVKAPLRLLGDSVWTQLPFATTSVTGGGAFVLRQGTLKCASGDSLETTMEIGEGGALEIAVREDLIHTGYVSPAVLGTGGVIRFIGLDGQEIGVGRPEMNVLPGADVVWTPTSEGPNTLSTDANWSSGKTPGEGDVVLTDGGLSGGATVTLAAAQAFGVITVKEGAHITFTADGGAVAGQRLVIGVNASVTLPTAAVGFKELMVMPGATVAFADAGEAAQVESLTVNGQIDLRGTTLSAASFGGIGTVTDTLEPVEGGRTGELHLTVASGSQTLELMLGGFVKAVKEGAGTLMLGTMSRTNSGGWEIAAGTVKPSANLNDSRVFGQIGTTITVHEGATYDMNDQRDSRVYRFVLNGGTIANYGSSGIPLASGCIGEITLTTNSFLNAYSSFPLWGKVDLNGYTLTVDIRSSRYLYLYKGDDTVGGTFTNGTVNFRSGGYFRPDSVSGDLRDMRTVDFVFGAALDLQTSIDVRNLAAGWRANHANGSGKVGIYGVFTPNAENYLNNFELQGGATLNLAGWKWAEDGIYDIAASVTGQVLGFTENATIYVSLGDHKVSNKEKVVSWPVGKKPNVKFRPMPGMKYSFVAAEDGLYVVKGLMILFR